MTLIAILKIVAACTALGAVIIGGGVVLDFIDKETD
jgi:hypothetical protein